jgi:hypothetical protein
MTRWQLRNRLMSELLGQSGNALPGVRPPGLGLTDLRDGMTFNAVGETVGLVISTAKKTNKINVVDRPPLHHLCWVQAADHRSSKQPLNKLNFSTQADRTHRFKL